MHPTHRGPDDGGGRESHDSGALARTVQVVAGEYLLTVNPVDGSEIEPCPPDRRPASPERRTAAARAERRRAETPPQPVGDAALDLPLLERAEERRRLTRLLARGRSVRLTGPSGAGRTALLDAVEEDCAGLAPDGVVRLSGYRRGVEELLWELYATVFETSRYRPGRAELLDALAGVGAVVLVDDLEFGGAALDELLTATPECALLLTATPQAPAPPAHAELEEVALPGISRTACVELLERAGGRAPSEQEADWAGDLWFESEGLPLRFVQAGALLRHRDAASAADGASDGAEPDGGAGSEPGAGAEAVTGAEAADTDGDGDGDTDGDGGTGPSTLPPLTVASVSAVRLAETLSAAGRRVLRFAVALGGEVPQAAHLPALLDDQRADAALAELTSAGLATSAGPHYRLAAGVTEQLADAGYGEGAEALVRTAAQHYAWWGGHPSVTPKRVAAESEAVLAAVTAARAAGATSAAVLLARTAAPVFAAAGRWAAWERVLTEGWQAAEQAGEVAEEAYFHHELGVHALCEGDLGHARAELERAMELRGRLADRRGQFAGRRALALVADAAGEPLAPDLDDEELAAAEAATTVQPVVAPGAVAQDTAPLPGPGPVVPGGTDRRPLLTGTRRNLVAAAAGALLAVLLGTVVTLSSVSSGGEDRDRVQPDRSSTQPETDDSFEEVAPSPSDEEGDDTGRPGPSGSPESPEESAGTPSGSASPEESSGDPSPTDDGEPNDPSPSDSPDDTTGGPGTDGGTGDAGGTDGGGDNGGGDDGGGDDGADGGGDAQGGWQGGSEGGGSSGADQGGSNTGGGDTDGGSEGGETTGGSEGGGTDGGADEGGDNSGADGGSTGSPSATGPAPSSSRSNGTSASPTGTAPLLL
ncbi:MULTISPECIES: ATP-binding protein [Streptomyces]|uniref:ATP-binding protein n=1 Tax=Streptomyces TaxID=1883 RepID=UPI00224915EB|nr:ATP-binding protein [Streptomyces sp. JHD 1]MCX2967329.1 ATP-binding protein [Streptomyces sp. JHD 1]